MHIVNQKNYADAFIFNNNNNNNDENDIDFNRISNELDILLDDQPVIEPINSKKKTQRNNKNRSSSKKKKLEKTTANLICSSCLKQYTSQAWFARHKCDPKKIKLLVNALANRATDNIETARLFAELPLFDSEAYPPKQHANTNIPNECKSYLDQLRELKSKEFTVLHLNINAVFNKINELNLISDSKLYDIATINESKLDEQVPISFFTNPNYSCLRRDRKGKGGGGLLVFIKRQYSIVKSSDSYKSEVISFQLKINNEKYNFISCYKSPKQNDDDFIDELGNILFELLIF